jgi:hypothetical protein
MSATEVHCVNLCWEGKFMVRGEDAGWEFTVDLSAGGV